MSYAASQGYDDLIQLDSPISDTPAEPIDLIPATGPYSRSDPFGLSTQPGGALYNGAPGPVTTTPAPVVDNPVTLTTVTTTPANNITSPVTVSTPMATPTAAGYSSTGSSGGSGGNTIVRDNKIQPMQKESTPWIYYLIGAVVIYYVARK